MIQVIDGADVTEKAFEKGDYLGKGCKLMNSEEFTGSTVEEAKEAITEKLVGQGVARRTVNGYLRDNVIGESQYRWCIWITGKYVCWTMRNCPLCFLNLKIIRVKMVRLLWRMLWNGSIMKRMG